MSSRNLANTKPPEFIKIEDGVYSIDYDFLTWIDVLELLDELDLEDITAEDVEIIKEIEILIFGDTLNVNIFSVLQAVTGFAAGYPLPMNPNTSAPSQNRRLFDFKLDLNSILIAIRDQSGIDLTTGKSRFHWWLFLVEFHNLTGEHHISKLMELRAYDGDDKEMKRARDAVALPQKVSRKQQKFNDEMDKIFYNC